MKAKALGTSQVNFVDNNGRAVTGTSIYIAFSDEKVTGLKADKVFVRSDIELPDIKPNDTLELLFDMRGRVEAVNKLWQQSATRRLPSRCHKRRNKW